MDALPQSLQSLLIALSVGLLGLVTWVIRAVVQLFGQLNRTLTNHFAHDNETLAEIARHMATQTELLRLILDELRRSPR